MKMICVNERIEYILVELLDVQLLTTTTKTKLWAQQCKVLKRKKNNNNNSQQHQHILSIRFAIQTTSFSTECEPFLLIINSFPLTKSNSWYTRLNACAIIFITCFIVLRINTQNLIKGFYRWHIITFYCSLLNWDDELYLFGITVCCCQKWFFYQAHFTKIMMGFLRLMENGDFILKAVI